MWSLDVDEHGVLHEIEDSEGNFVHPVFDTDEWQELDNGFLEENPIQYMVCGDCHEIIDTYETKEMTPYEKLEWIHCAIQEALNGNLGELPRALEMVEDIREPYLID